MNTRGSVLVSLLSVAVLLQPVVGGAEPVPADKAGGVAAAMGGGEGAAAGKSQRRRRETPDAMVLCRGPRGAVYARDVNEGCRNTKLDAGNLVDFGAGDDCLLRRASSFDPKGEKTADAQTCQDICKAADADRKCVTAVLREGDSWTTFSSEKSFPLEDPMLRDASIVCCKP